MTTRQMTSCQMTTRQTLYFVQPYTVEVRHEDAPALAAHQVRVRTTCTAISAGTEMLFYRGQVPTDMAVDTTIATLGDTIQYPLTYGYCAVGVVEDVGDAVDNAWHGRRVFAFHPHTSEFNCEPATLISLPDWLTDEQAAFLPNMETAVNFTMDAHPLVGERVVVMGLGIVGLLTVYLLRHFPLEALHAVDGYANRRAVAQRWGITSVIAPNQLAQQQGLDPDLIVEVSSNPAALENALQLSGYGTRILVGSWYGTKQAQLSLGGSFHRNRIQLLSSQVSTIDGRFSNRWDKNRRLQAAMRFLRDLPVDDLITHRFPLAQARDAYALLDQHPEQTMQILFSY